MKLANKVAVITGGGSGIGRAAALLYAAEGAKIVIADWSADPARRTVQLIESANGRAVFVRTDVSVEKDVENMFSTAVATFGSIDILLNCAGIEGPRVAAHETAADDFDRVVAINLKGIFLSSKHAVLKMQQRNGVIINIASVGGLLGFPLMPAYAAAKGGVVAITKQMAMDYAPNNIRVNCICPGFVHTPLTNPKIEGKPEKLREYNESVPLGRIGQPEDIASAALFLASDDSSFITGVALPVDGGMMARTQAVRPSGTAKRQT